MPSYVITFYVCVCVCAYVYIRLHIKIIMKYTATNMDHFIQSGLTANSDYNRRFVDFHRVELKFLFIFKI